MLLFLLVQLVSIAQQNYFVAITGTDSPGNGTQLNPYATLKYALNDITHVAGDSIFIAAGTYNDININLSLSDINIIGSGINNTNFVGGGFFMNITGSNVLISKMNIMGYGDAGAVDIVSNSSIDSTYITFDNCAFKDNISFAGFDANPEGGAIYATRGAGNLPVVLTIVDCQFNSNTAEDGLGGGAIFIEQSRLQMTGSRMMCNNDRLGLTTYDGGAIYFNNSSGYIEDCFFSGNKVFDRQGGAIYCDNASAARTITIKKTVFKGNKGREGGAVFLNDNYNLNMINCLVVENDLTTGFGNGGVINSNGSNNNISIISSTIANNNKVGGTGDPKGLVNSSCNTFVVDNCIIWGNDDEDVQDFGAGSIVVSNSVIDLTGGTSYIDGGGNSNANPNFVGSGDFTVQAGSVAIGRANATTEPSEDLLATTRNLQTSGAYEFGSTFTPFTEICSTILPVELISFKGKCESTISLLEWVTASEINNDYFIIQKSWNAINYSSIGRVEGNGNTNYFSVYQYEDDEQSSTTVYYRLKQVDYNGDYSYSNVLAIEPCVNNSNDLVNAYYNANSNELVLDYYNAFDEFVVMSIVDMKGRKVMEEELFLNSSENSKKTILRNNLNAGLYLVVIASKANAKSFKVIVSN